MDKHTAGPWEHSGVRLKMGNFEFHTIYAPGKPDISVAAVWYDSKRRHAEDFANAKLIAATPLLLDAAKDLAKEPCTTFGAEDIEPGCCPSCRARRAVAAATA